MSPDAWLYLPLPWAIPSLHSPMNCEPSGYNSVPCPSIFSLVQVPRYTFPSSSKISGSLTLFFPLVVLTSFLPSTYPACNWATRSLFLGEPEFKWIDFVSDTSPKYRADIGLTEAVPALAILVDGSLRGDSGSVLITRFLAIEEPFPPWPVSVSD